MRDDKPKDKPFAVTATLLMTATLSVMAGAIVSPSLPALALHFADVPRIDYLTRFIITVPSLSMALLAPFVGYVVDRFGRRVLLIAGIVLYAAAGAGGALFDSITAILVSRAFLGASTAAIMTTVGTLIGDYYAGARRNQIMGLRNASNNFGGVIYLMLGGFLATIDWRAPFLIYLVALALLPLILRHVEEPGRGHAAAALAAGEDEGPAPWFDIAWIYVAAFAFGVSFYLIPTQIPFYLIDLGFTEPTLAGFAIAAATLATAMTALFYGRIRRRLSVGVMFVYGFALSGVGLALIATAADLPLLFAGLVLFGAGQGSTTANFSIRLLDLAPYRLRGRIMGFMATAIMMGFFVSPLFSQTVALVWNLASAFAAGGVLMLCVSGMFLVQLLRSSGSRG